MALAKTLRSYAELVQMLMDVKAPHRAHLEHQTVEIESDPELPGPLHVRWEKVHPFVQLIQPIVVAVPVERVRDIETAVLRLNNVSMFPGVSYDHRAHTVYDRVTAVILVDGVRLDLLHAYMQGLMINAKQLRRPLLRVVEGGPGDAVLGG